jgi:hypothetical protein
VDPRATLPAQDLLGTAEQDELGADEHATTALELDEITELAE